MSLWSRATYALRCSPIARSRCRRATHLLQAHLDGRLDAEGTRLLREHLDGCRQCGLEAEVYARIKASLAGDGGIPPESVRRLEAFAARLTEDGVPPG